MKTTQDFKQTQIRLKHFYQRSNARCYRCKDPANTG